MLHLPARGFRERVVSAVVLLAENKIEGDQVQQEPRHHQVDQLQRYRHEAERTLDSEEQERDNVHIGYTKIIGGFEIGKE